MPKSCAISNCKTGSKGLQGKRSLFRIPTNLEMRKKWENAIPPTNKKLKDNQSICERHFLPKDVFKKWTKYDSDGNIIAEMNYPRARLNPQAIPCIFTDDVPPDPVDAWTAYRQQQYGYEYETIISNNSNVDKSDNREDSTKDPVESTENVPTKMLDLKKKLENNESRSQTQLKILTAHSNALREVYSTGEHSYCRTEIDRNDYLEGSKNVISLSMGMKSSENHENFNDYHISSDSPAFNCRIKKEPEETPEGMSVDQLFQVLEDDNDESMNEKSSDQRLQYSEKSTREINNIDRRLVSSASTKNSKQLTSIDLDTNLEVSRYLISDIGIEDFEPVTEEGSDVQPEPKKCQLRVDTGGVYEDEDELVRLPYMWGVNEVVMPTGRQIIFSHTILVLRDNVEVPILKKSVKVDDKSGKIEYYAHGKLLDTSKTRLPQNITDILSFQITLYTFQKMRICGGITPNSKSIHKDMYQDMLDYWRHINCKLLVQRGKCEPCLKLQRLLSQKRRRAEKNQGTHRISSTLDPNDQIVLLKKKLGLEKRRRIHAQAQVKRLTEASKENAVKVTFVKNIQL